MKKQEQPNSEQPLVITIETLKELEAIAVTMRTPVDDALNYSLVQRLITVQALSQWISSYNIKPQFLISVGDKNK